MRRFVTDWYPGMAEMKAKVNRAICLRCGSCEALCPSVFVVKTDGVHVLRTEVPVSRVEACRAAANACPVDAISLRA